MYLTAMPAGRPGDRKDYSCDANAGNPGSVCPEFDIVEANARATQSTLHKCDLNGGNYSNCDQGGAIAKPSALGLFDQTTGSVIDTSKVFNVSVAFRAGNVSVDTVDTVSAGESAGGVARGAAGGGAGRGSSGRAALVGMEVTYSQSGRNFTLVPTTDASYLQSLTEAMEHGLVAQMSLWGGAASVMSWLDEPPCSASEDCDPTAVATWSNFAVRSL
jgi:hypothetical protein